jgi:hypothetical protein
METKTFKVFRATNGRGVSNLLLVTEESVTDMSIGSCLLVPVPEGLKDPVEVSVVVDASGAPMRTNFDTCIVTLYIH